MGILPSRVSTSMSSVGSYGKPQAGIPPSSVIFICPHIHLLRGGSIGRGVVSFLHQ